jgi:hypothetical protein
MLNPKETLSEDDVTKGLSFIIRDGLATQAMVTLTSGIFLVAFGLQLGASNTVIGLLAAIPPLAELIQMPAISHCSWNSWMRDFVPRDILGSFFSRRMSLSLALGIVLSLFPGSSRPV